MAPDAKILYVVHNHPRIRPGGAEAYALELHEAMREVDGFEPIFLARSGPPLSKTDRYHEGTLVTRVDGEPDQYFIYTPFNEFDWLLGTTQTKPVITRFFRDFVAAQQPDVVHFQHTLFVGYEAIREVRNVLPNAAIVYTLHEFLAICHRQGQLLRTESDEPCMAESPRRCHECFPNITPQEFFMRKRFIQSHLSLVDMFVAPSQFLRDRYVDWGVPPEKIRFEDYGRRQVAPATSQPREKRQRVAFFGQLSKFKGVNVLLEAARKLTRDDVDFELSVYGANLELQPEDFRLEFDALLEAGRERVTFHGDYDHDDLPALMAKVDWIVVPSIWWENSPLVIQEAFMYGRPIICSDIGAMAEKVTDDVDGLHFRAADPDSLAERIAVAVGTPGLWDRLQAGIRPIHSMDAHTRSMAELYAELLARRADGGPVEDEVRARAPVG